jgi:hypothetical protein
LQVDAAGHAIEPAALSRQFEEAGNWRARSLVTEALVEDRAVPDPVKQLPALVTRFRNQSIDKEIAGVRQALELASREGADTTELLHELTALQQAKRTALAPLAPAASS